MPTFITDRTQDSVRRRNALSAKGEANMTSEEKREWYGRPLDYEGYNLLPNGPYYSPTVNVVFKKDNIVATALTAGSYISSVVLIGDAEDFEDKLLVLSMEELTYEEGSVPRLALFWHDETGQSYAGGEILPTTPTGNVVVNTAEFPNTDNRQYLALYIYANADGIIKVGDTAVFKKVMLTMGANILSYVPYTAIVPTECTKGAYNYSDLNRVEQIVADISEGLSLGLVTKTDWGMWDIPTVPDMERYLGNVKTIRDYYYISIELPATMANLTYVEANNIEKILSEAYTNTFG